MEEEHVIACLRVKDINEDLKVASLMKKCVKCKHWIWVALSTPTIEGAKYMCMQCIDWDAVEKISNPTPEQIQDLKKHRGH